jgi:hypothetical protein
MKASKEIIDYFVRSFRIVKSPRPMATIDPSLLKVTILQSNLDDGVRLEMANEDFDELIEFALEGRSHKEFRLLHPAAQEAYNNYLALYNLTRKHA